MGMMIGGIVSGTRAMQIKNRTVASGFRISKTNQQKKTKRLNYNFKSVSSQIMLSKTANSAGKAVTKARGMLVMLLRKLDSGDYDDQELEHAIIHARKMERIAKKRQRHLKQEEDIAHKGTSDEQDVDIMEELQKQADENEEAALNEEELRRMLAECEQLMQEAMEEFAMEELTEQAQMEELSEEFSGAVYRMQPEDLERLKKKHRSDEMREIIDADMKYLKAVFNKLERERQELASGAKSFDAPGGVSLEISGLDIPIETAEMPVMIESGGVDVIL